jgi:hypothetical protein
MMPQLQLFKISIPEGDPECFCSVCNEIVESKMVVLINLEPRGEYRFHQECYNKFQTKWVKDQDPCVPCKRCGKLILWCITPKNGEPDKSSYIPVDWDTLSEEEKTSARRGLYIKYNRPNPNDPNNKSTHITHFATCPNAEEFRKKK